MIGPKPDLLSARFDNVMFAYLQPSDFLRSVCLHCREMSMIHMRPLKAAGLSFNFGNVTTSSDVILQVYAST